MIDRTKLIADARSIVDRAEAEGRALTAQEVEREAALWAAVDELYVLTCVLPFDSDSEWTTTG